MLFIFILKLISLNKSLALDPSTICLRNEIYQGHNDNIIRKYEDCKGKWPIKCGINVCVSFQESCRSLADLMFISKPQGFAQIIRGKIIAYSSLMKKVKQCQHTFILDPNDVCVNGKICYQVTSVRMR